MEFDHIGVVVASLCRGRSALESGYGVNRWTEEYSDEINGVMVQFGTDSIGLCYELIAPLGPTSPVSRTQRRGTNITNHVAFKVSSLPEHRDKLLLTGFHPLGDPNAAVAFGGAPIQFFLSPINSIIELVEAPGHRHHYNEVAL
jgi:methylmalonyl-CoA/ethylmalonyl-CoA epimerase